MWERMSVDEYAAFESAQGAKVIKVEGIWWRTVRPFFYQPLFPFLELVPRTKKTPAGAVLGGFQHLVPAADLANSRRTFFIWDDIHNYSLEAISHQTRSNIKKGMKHFSIKPIDSVDEFIVAGHPVYLSFYERTKYSYKKERVDRNCFAEWARTLYGFPKIRILGAYHQGELSAVDISYLVVDVLFAATFFSKTEHLKYQVVDLMTHEMQVNAVASSAIKFIYKGPVTGRTGVDGSKLRRGCKVLSKPAFYRLNPLAEALLRTCLKSSYKKITG